MRGQLCRAWTASWRAGMARGMQVAWQARVSVLVKVNVAMEWMRYEFAHGACSGDDQRAASEQNPKFNWRQLDCSVRLLDSTRRWMQLP